MKMLKTFGMLLAAAVSVAALATYALAQTSDGPFAQLSPGQQKIARALLEAQPKSTAPNAPKPLTLDEIASMKKGQGQEGWGNVFKDMKKQGLVSQKNLGEVVSAYEKRHPETAKLDKPAERSGKPDKPEKPAKPERMEKPEKPEKPGR
jgi:hypothetical protein